MREIDKYNVLKEKLKGICEENGLTYSIREKKFPYILTIKPLGGIDALQTMMEGMENPGDTGYISPDASIVFENRDGFLAYKISETFTINDTLFTKIKNLFKNMHILWMMFFFRKATEDAPNDAPTSEDDTETADGQAEENCEVEDADTDDAFSDFMADAEPALEDEDTEE